MPIWIKGVTRPLKMEAFYWQWLEGINVKRAWSKNVGNWRWEFSLIRCFEGRFLGFVVLSDVWSTLERVYVWYDREPSSPPGLFPLLLILWIPCFVESYMTDVCPFAQCSTCRLLVMWRRNEVKDEKFKSLLHVFLLSYMCDTSTVSYMNMNRIWPSVLLWAIIYIDVGV